MADGTLLKVAISTADLLKVAISNPDRVKATFSNEAPATVVGCRGHGGAPLCDHLVVFGAVALVLPAVLVVLRGAVLLATLRVVLRTS
jgi:hypothetical protein